jgi:hypothetical protein
MHDDDPGLEDARDDWRAEREYQRMLDVRDRWEQHYEPLPATLAEFDEQAAKRRKRAAKRGGRKGGGQQTPSSC